MRVISATHQRWPRDRLFRGYGQNPFRMTLLHKWTISQHPSSCRRTSSLWITGETTRYVRHNVNYLPVGTSKHSKPFFLATKSIALLVGILLANPFTPPAFLKYGITSAQWAMIATESDGVTNAPFP